MLATEEGIAFHFCRDATAAIDRAAEVQPTVILQDLVMPEVEGLELVRRYRADERFRDVPVIVLSTKEEPEVKAEAFARGANDYIVKLPDRLELVARVRYHSRGYTALLERNEAFAALQKSQKVLAHDLETAAHYVRSLLPPPQALGNIQADWRFIPSASLGGDAFGYHDIDAEHMAVYLLDVCGHGVGAALLSVSALNAIRSEALPQTDFRDPGAVLAGLNRAFPMERHNDMFFTAWYGVYCRATRRLRWSGGGHPPAILLPEGGTRHMLDSEGPLVGAVEGLEYEASEVAVPPGSRIYIYSDGAYEIIRTDGTMWPFADFVEMLSGAAFDQGAGDGTGNTGMPRPLDSLLEHIRGLSGREDFQDDCSIVELIFGGDGSDSTSAA